MDLFVFDRTKPPAERPDLMVPDRASPVSGAPSGPLERRVLAFAKPSDCQLLADLAADASNAGDAGVLGDAGAAADRVGEPRSSAGRAGLLTGLETLADELAEALAALLELLAELLRELPALLVLDGIAAD